jgi:hypothetical protein
MAEPAPGTAARIELLHVPSCPLVDRVLTTIEACLAEAGLTDVVQLREGSFASPTLLIDGSDVAGARAQTGACCRLDLPTREQILAALNASGS